MENYIPYPVRWGWGRRRRREDGGLKVVFITNCLEALLKKEKSLEDQWTTGDLIQTGPWIQSCNGFLNFDNDKPLDRRSSGLSDVGTYLI